jgi:predicted lipid-binding transport protein (Tim44 family)
MRPLDDKKDFRAGDSEDNSRIGPFPLDSPDEEMETELSEEELAAEMEPFTVADWNRQFPDATPEELEEKLPDHTRARWMAPVMSGLFGTLLGAAIAGLKVNDQPRQQQVRAFFIFFLVLSLLFSCLWHWFFFVRPERVAKKMKQEQENLVDSGPVQQENPVGSEPIHPK